MGGGRVRIGSFVLTEPILPTRTKNIRLIPLNAMTREICGPPISSRVREKRNIMSDFYFTWNE